MSFPDFIYLVLEGPHELAEYIQKNRMSGESIGIDTGMVDGKGMSRKWAPFWHQCGLCHLDYRPHYILHFDHAQDDEEVKNGFGIESIRALTIFFSELIIQRTSPNFVLLCSKKNLARQR